MKKYLKPLLIAMILVPAMVVLAACGGGVPSTQMSDGMYSFDSVTFNGVTVTLPTLPTKPTITEVLDPEYVGRPTVATTVDTMVKFDAVWLEANPVLTAPTQVATPAANASVALWEAYADYRAELYVHNTAVAVREANRISARAAHQELLNDVAAWPADNAANREAFATYMTVTLPRFEERVRVWEVEAATTLANFYENTMGMTRVEARGLAALEIGLYDFGTNENFNGFMFELALGGMLEMFNGMEVEVVGEKVRMFITSDDMTVMTSFAEYTIRDGKVYIAGDLLELPAGAFTMTYDNGTITTTMTGPDDDVIVITFKK
jgi:hypothetical protein